MLQLNNNQKTAVEHGDGPLLVLAGAGTGKTRVLTARIAYLIENGLARPDQILAVTFTNKAANEMLHRINNIVNSNGIWIGTFHSIAAKILRQNSNLLHLSANFTIIGVDDQLRLIKRIMEENQINEKEFPPKLFLHIIQRWKDLAISANNVAQCDIQSSAHLYAKKIYTQYQEKLQFLDAVDFGDLLLNNINLLSQNHDLLKYYNNKFKYILVDEYQDTNIAQYMWLRLLAGESKNICCVGDEDQSIYGWRGAEVGNILKFEKDFPNATIIRLEQNYRSTNNILAAASALISNNSSRYGKTLWSNSEEGDKIHIITLSNDREEAKYIARTITQFCADGKSPQDIAILVRASFQTRSFEECFVNFSIPYRIIGGLKFYERQEIKDVIAYLRIIVNPSDSLALERIINTPKRGIGMSTIAQISDYAIAKQLPLITAVSEMIDDNLLKPKIKTALSELLQSINRWQDYLKTYSISQSIDLILNESGYLNMWKAENTIEAQGKIENIKELQVAIAEFETINEFLEHISLVSDNDNTENTELVSLMTIHSAKGLEFDTVFLPGFEDGIFPHHKAIKESHNGIEEERRLAYVAFTRAKNHLYITKTHSRMTYNNWQVSLPSRFISEIPEAYTNNADQSYNYHYQSSMISKTPELVINKNSFGLGSRVMHKKFGLGYIINIQNDQLEISFDRYGKKRVIDSFVEKVK